MTSKIRPGRYRKDLGLTEREILKALEENPKRWKQLWETPTIKEEARSERKLGVALSLLQDAKLIERVKKTRKNVTYVLSEHALIIRQLVNLEKTFKDFIDGLETIPNESQEDEITQNHLEAIQSILWGLQLATLRLVKALTILTPNQHYLIKSWFQDIILETYIHMIKTCQKILPDTTNSAIEDELRKTETRIEYSTPAENDTLCRIQTINQKLVSQLFRDE